MLRTKARYTDEMSERERRNLGVAYRAACGSIVLLKNDGVLPLAPGRLALYGAGASRTVKGGTGSGEVNERHSVTIEEGLKSRGFEVTTEGWLRDFDAEFERCAAETLAAQRRAVRGLSLGALMESIMLPARLPDGRDVTDADIAASGTGRCVYVLARQPGEGSDRRLEKGDYYPSGAELRAIRKCAERYEEFVLVINSGGPIDLSFADEIESIGAIVYMCQLGTEGGSALADVLSGAVSPSGKLADTWPMRYEDLPFAMEYSYLNGDLKNEYYSEGIYVGYRYFDTFGVEPRYRFGYGLGYSGFSLEPGALTADGTRVSLAAAVKNTGARYSGRETAQLYVSCPGGKLDREYQSLAAFEKSPELAPGQSAELSLGFDLAELAAYDEESDCFVLEKGDYILRLGTSSADTVIAAVVTLGGDAVVSRHERLCPAVNRIDALTAPPRPDGPIPPGVPRALVDPAAFRTIEHSYDTPEIYPDERVRGFVGGLTAAEMAEIVVGIGQFGGRKEFNLPGAVGNTTSKFWERGLANATFCDGPAGLRLQKRSVVTKDGRLRAVDLAMHAYELLPGFVQSFLRADPEKGELAYQFTTAFPVASALAQTWDRALLREVGEAIHEEMREYGCVFWLAPAVNIHRNPLCGRNFEYFSEDPLLTGSLAASLTRGVQSGDGHCAVVKHFACNNQEENRMAVSSNVSARALREIYLRAFRRVVREGGARGVMTSYNRLNGVYTPNSHDLCTKLLRCEWGFDGVVMTDWFSTAPGKADAALAIRAGNDLIMPGGASFKMSLIKAVKSGRISEDELRRCCANVVKCVMDGCIQREYFGA